MKLKANIHFHSKEDPHDTISYNLFEGIDKAAELNFDVLAVTCHNEHVAQPEHIKYANQKGILLIPGIETTIQHGDKRAHVVILNCKKDIEEVATFSDLEAYKKHNPNIFVLAAHPYHIGNFSLHSLLEDYIHLFDAIEHSWFYSKWFDRNVKAKQISELYNKPYIATSDTHYFDFFNKSYTTVESDEKTPQAFFNAMTNGQYTNTTSPRKLFTEMFLKTLFFIGKSKLTRITRKFTPVYATVQKETS